MMKTNLEVKSSKFAVEDLHRVTTAKDRYQTGFL